LFGELCRAELRLFGNAERYGLEATVVVMRLYDTRRGQVVSFEPGPVVAMYVCGITPYDATHVGHAATYITYDILQRRLVDIGHEVRYVRNITDVDNDLLKAAKKRGVHYLDLAFGETARFDDDMAALNILPPWSEPRATGAISNIRGVIESLLQSGHAYLVRGTVYFDTGYVDTGHGGRPPFGSLSQLGTDRMMTLSREWGEDPGDPAKRHPLDFELWRPSEAGEPSWDARWGSGRPGWHVECSALALRELGTTIDLHGGGIDLLYPHHECVNAQSEALTGEPFVRHWLHQSMVHYRGHKMSKSTGNLVFVHELRARVDPRVIRLSLCLHHYRRPWNWTDELLEDAAGRLATWEAASGGTEPSLLDHVRRCLDDDLDVPGAVEAIDAAAAGGVRVDDAAALLGIDVTAGPRWPRRSCDG